MTNDGDTAHALLHPSLGNEREYRVNVKGQLDARAIKRLERGVTLDEGRTSPARVSDVRFDPDSGTSSLTLTLSEGKKRQIRRSLLVLGFPVRRLVRVRMGPLRIGRLAVGEARPLRSEEKRALLEHVRRLRAGEAPEATSTRSDSARRTDAAHKAPASFPSHKPTRRKRGEAGVREGAGARSGSGRSSAGKKAARKKKAVRRKGSATKRSSGAAGGGSASGSAGKKQSAKKRGASPAARRGSVKGRARKSSAARKPAKGGRQRTPASRKGPRK
jgi:23S rRNA pseudouridine2605 synthase